MLVRKVGKEEDIWKIWLVSADPVDVVGVRAMGMQAVLVDQGSGFRWADRSVQGKQDRRR
jgi:hypothetical protein